MERSSLRAGAMAAVVGGVLALVGNLLHPRWTDLDDVETYRKIADSDVWKPVHLLLTVAIVLTIAGVTAIARSLEGGEAHALARYGLLAAVVGGAVAVADISLDGYALRMASENFAAASGQDQVSAFWATNAIDHVATAMFNVWTFVLLGVAPLLLGIAALRTRRYPTWVAAAGALGGVAAALTGLVGLTANDQDDLTIPFLVGSLLVTVWVIGAGVHLWRTLDREPVVTAA